MSEPVVLALAVSNAALLLVLCLAYRAVLLFWVSRRHEAAMGLVSLRTLLVLYGLTLVYILLALRRLRNAMKTDKHSKSKYIPVYNEHDVLTGYVHASRKRRNATGQPLAMAPRASAHSDHLIEHGWCRFRHCPSTGHQSLQGSRRRVGVADWNGWPDGDIKCHITRAELAQDGNLATFWATDAVPGRRPGSLDAVTSNGGKKYEFRCLGAIRCESAHCHHDLCIAPATNLKYLKRQLSQHCICGHILKHAVCHVQCSASAFRYGALFTHRGEHNHGHYTHRLLMTPGTAADLVEFTDQDWHALLRLPANFDNTDANYSAVGEEEDPTPAINPQTSDEKTVLTATQQEVNGVLDYDKTEEEIENDPTGNANQPEYCSIPFNSYGADPDLAI
ncbi:hypothetical protein GGX14DRAFT_394503 [Mycena pura]|uniref:Uncharacterized protein n=1 Tax=Mycena pura TaxID=153505 RepID=A0AAD6VF93_9AGAR|nr:hypothetical protein GGX14DRAFT_394503 [Mycena pura]